MSGSRRKSHSVDVPSMEDLINGYKNSNLDGFPGIMSTLPSIILHEVLGQFLSNPITVNPQILGALKR